jgi:hypothetical protein
MRLKSIIYRENVGRKDANPWELTKLTLGEQNLIVAKNATGKTRIVNVICNLARLIQSPQIMVSGILQKVIFNGEWIALFSDEGDRSFEFHLSLEKGMVLNEQIVIDGEKKLERQHSSAKIYSNIASEMQEIAPPNDHLVLHVRRDQNEFPFLESLVSWANGVHGLAFANTSPMSIEIPGTPFQLTSLNAVPSILEQLSESQLKRVLHQLRDMDYDIEAATIGPAEGFPPSAKIVFLKERTMAIPFKQFEISQGMFRAFSLLVIVEFFRSSGNGGSILIDDLGEGLDSERCKKLAKLIFEEKPDSKLQLVATSNDSFLVNSVPLNELTVCYRSNHSIKCLNYLNSKQKFDDWQKLGLNNFDLLSSNFLLD